MFAIKSINQCNLFIAYYCLYNVLKAYNSSTTTGYMLILLVLVSFGYFVYVLFNMRQPVMLKWLSVVFIVFGFYGFVNLFLVDDAYVFGYFVSRVDYIKLLCESILPVFPFYYFARRGMLTNRVIFTWLPVLLIASSYEFLQFYNARLEYAIKNGAYKIKEFTNNIGYVFVSLLPLLFLKQKKVLFQFIMIGITVFFIVSSAKRGAIIAGALAIVYFLHNVFFKANRKNIFKYYIVGVVVVIIAGYYISNYIEHSLYFQYRLEQTAEGNSSFRNIIYSRLWNAFIDSDFVSIFFGHGAFATAKFAYGMYAHNDWLEILTDHGLFGFFIYVMFFYSVFKTWHRFKDSDFGTCIGALSIIIFLTTIYSMSYNNYDIGIQIAFGYCMGRVADADWGNKRLRE